MLAYSHFIVISRDFSYGSRAFWRFPSFSSTVARLLQVSATLTRASSRLYQCQVAVYRRTLFNSNVMQSSYTLHRARGGILLDLISLSLSFPQHSG